MLALDTDNNTNAKTYIIFFLLTYTSEDFVNLLQVYEIVTGI
jgi:hypothetical protein